MFLGPMEPARVMQLLDRALRGDELGGEIEKGERTAMVFRLLGPPGV